MSQPPPPPESHPPYGYPPPHQEPLSSAERKRQAREAKAVAKANRNWFARHKILTAIGVIALLAIIGALLNPSGDETATPQTSTPAASEAAETNEPAAAAQTDPASAEETDPADAAPAEPTTAPEPAETTPAAAAASLGNGDHIVGADIDPGVYRAEVEDSFIPLCTVHQSVGEDILDVRNANEGSVIFTVADKADSVVSFSGCSNIMLAADSIRPEPNPITNGYWLVGEELAPGQYRGTVDTDSAIALGTILQHAADGGVMDVRNANEGNVVFTVKEAAGSVVSFSGFTEIEKVG